MCIAGSVNSYARLAEIRAAGLPILPSAAPCIFDHVFGDDFAAQIDAVCAYMEGPTVLERWYPWGWAPNVFAIDYAKLQALGYKRAFLFDIDNTLVHHGADATPKVEALFRELDAME